MDSLNFAEEFKVGYWEWAYAEQPLLVDDALKSLLGYELFDFPDSVEGWKKLVPEHDLEALTKHFQEHVGSKGLSPFACDVRVKNKEGHFLDVYIVGRIISWDEQGRPSKMIGSHTDISSLKREKKELLEVKQMLNRTSQTAMVGGWEIDLETNKVSWTEETRNIFEVGPDFIPIRGSSQGFFKEGYSRDILVEAFKEAVTTGKAYDLELQVITAKGKEIWTRTIGQPEFENGKCTRLYGIFQNITERKYYENRLIRQQEQFQSFILHTPAAIAVMDRQMNYVAVSNVWRKMYKLETADILGKNHYELFPGLPERWKEFNRRCLQGEVIRCDEDSFQRLDGTEDWLQWEMRPWLDLDGSIGGLIVFTEIITEKKQFKEMLISAKETAEEATLAKSQFLSVMSHEIRTPMNAVIGFTNLLLQNPREDQKEYLNILKFSGENLMVLINDILDLNKIDAGKIIFEEVDFNIKNLLINIHASLRQLAIEKALFLEINLDPAIPDEVKGDPVRIGQVVTNLLNNAIKFTSTGKVSLVARMIGQENGLVSIYIGVLDTGIGIPKSKQEYIFEIFSQASTETTRKYGGTGLGLAITKRLLELMGSRIQLESEPGKGSAFSFEIRLKLAVEGSKTVQSASIKTAIGPISHLPVLIVEDNPINVLLVKRFLKQWHFDYQVAENGKIAVEMAQKQQYALILMDIQMPEMDGYEATELIRKIPGYEFDHLPIIALTASAVSNMQDRIYTSGMNDFVSKPFVPDVLYQKIAFHMKKEESVEK